MSGDGAYRRVPKEHGKSTLHSPLAWALSVVPLLIALLAAAEVGADTTPSERVLVLDETREEYDLESYLGTLPDPQGQWTIEEVSAPPLTQRFALDRPYSVVDIGIPMWIRLIIDNQTQTDTWVLEEHIITSNQNWIDLYIADDTGTWTHKRTGELIPFAERDIAHRHLGFRLQIEPGQTKTLYIRLSSASFPLILRSAKAFAQHDHHEQLVLGLYYGLLVVMALYNLFIFLSLRDLAYLYYIFAILFAGLWMFNFNGHAAEYLWPESTWGPFKPQVLLFGLGSGAIVLFVQRFLITKVHVPRLHRYLMVLLALHVPIVVFPFVDLDQAFVKVENFFDLAKWILLLLAGIFTWRQGFRAARFFVIAWAIFMFTGMLINLAFMGVLPFNFITIQGFMVGHAIEVVLLSLGLADRINLLREEKEAQEAELQTAHNMQMGLMPAEAPQIPGYDIAGRCLPASHVGGDFFQYFQRNGTLSVCLADVTGHGMEAAVPVMMFSGVLRSQMADEQPVVTLFSRLNQILHATLDKRTFVCLALGELTLAERRLRLANAACPYPFRYCAATGQVEELGIGAYPLGVRAEAKYTALERVLDRGDYLVFCSDGIIEANNAQGQMFGFEQAAQTIREGCAAGLSAAALIDRLFNAVQTFSGDESQGDDMTCVVVRISS